MEHALDDILWPMKANAGLQVPQEAIDDAIKKSRERQQKARALRYAQRDRNSTQTESLLETA